MNRCVQLMNSRTTISEVSIDLTLTKIRKGKKKSLDLQCCSYCSIENGNNIMFSLNWNKCYSKFFKSEWCACYLCGWNGNQTCICRVLNDFSRLVFVFWWGSLSLTVSVRSLIVDVGGCFVSTMQMFIWVFLKWIIVIIHSCIHKFLHHRKWR